MTSSTLDPNVPSLRDAAWPQEWQARVELAAGYRLVALFGWDDLVFTQQPGASLCCCWSRFSTCGWPTG